jgi:hypothetical protein
MLRYSRPPLRLIHRFQWMKGIARILGTFRTETGKTYGPEFIDLGLKIGEKILEFLQERFAAELAQGIREKIHESKNEHWNMESRDNEYFFAQHSIIPLLLFLFIPCVLGAVNLYFLSSRDARPIAIR